MIRLQVRRIKESNLKETRQTGQLAKVVLKGNHSVGLQASAGSRGFQPKSKPPVLTGGFDSVLLIMYVAGFIAQLIIHIQHQKERTLLPVWCMLTAVLMLVPLFEDFSILGSSWNFKGYFLSIVAYIAYLFTKLPKVIESYRYHATIRYAVWVALVLGIILSMLQTEKLSVNSLRVLSFLQAYYKLSLSQVTYNKTIKTRQVLIIKRFG